MVGLGINLCLIGSLNLKQTNPGLEIEELVLIRGRNTATLEGDFEEGLALGGNELIYIHGVATDLSNDLGRGILSALRGPVTKKNEGDANDGEKKQEEAF